ncbi:hypothetical protein IRJ41_016905 [Triplophysa rosa]|uniref:Uncharacterized protein n=1 Tax=Triplophysa rosa TaxID=992332 RepID=A0A9W7X491_TRIRA|nr:hypothetical protein IRJ41_016905 [Triplophysa rosa]
MSHLAKRAVVYNAATPRTLLQTKLLQLIILTITQESFTLSESVLAIPVSVTFESFWFLVKFKHLNLQLLLLWFVNYSGATDEPVSGILRGNATLLCESDATDIFSIDLSRLKSILSWQNETSDAESESQNGRVFKEGACGVFIKDKISVKKGEPLKLDVLLPNADKVEHRGKRTTGGKVVWSRSHGVRSDRMIIRDRNLTINNFTATDAGTYEVLDSEGQILIMVTVDIQKYFDTESEMSSTQQHTSPLLGMFLVGLVLLLVVLVAVREKRCTDVPEVHCTVTKGCARSVLVTLKILQKEAK